jgi:hypothetical protein
MNRYTESDLRRSLVDQSSAISISPEALLERFRDHVIRRHRRGLVAVVVATVIVIGVPAVTLATTLPGRSAPPQGQLALSYRSVCSREPDACLRQTPGNVPTALLRPLNPLAAPLGGSCPATAGHASNSRYVVGSEFGSGPVHLVFGDRGRPSRGRVVLGQPDASPWLAAENVLLISPQYRGPVSIRGRELGGSGVAYFDGSTVSTFIDPPFPDANSQPDGSRTPPASVFVRDPGCYSFQIDGLDFTQTIVIDLLAPRTAPAQ